MTLTLIFILYFSKTLLFSIIYFMLDQKHITNTLNLYNNNTRTNFNELFETNYYNIMIYYISFGSLNVNILISLIWFLQCIRYINNKLFFFKCYINYIIIVYSFYTIYLPYFMRLNSYLSLIIYLLILNVYLIYIFMKNHNIVLNKITKLIFINYEDDYEDNI